jgi:hypothetical protein
MRSFIYLHKRTQNMRSFIYLHKRTQNMRSFIYLYKRTQIHGVLIIILRIAKNELY